MALGKKFYRQAWPDMREDLRRAGASNLARRCYDELTIGRHSSATGALLLEPEYLRIDLGEHSRAKVVAALEELEQLGWLSWCRQTRAAVLPLHAHRCAGDNPSHTQGLLAECRNLPPSSQRDLAIEIITKVSKGSAEALARLNGESQHQKQEQEQKQKQDKKSSPYGELPVATAPVTREVDERSQSVVDNATAANANGPRTAASLFDDHTPASDANRQPRAKRARTVAESPPSREATRTFFERAGSTWAEADQCYDHHEARGWVSGRTPLKNWDAACRTWIANAAKYAMQRRTSGGGNRRPVYDEAAVWTPEAKARAERESTGEF